MKLLEEQKIGDFLSMGCELDKENEEVGLFLASADVSAACGFKFDEWEAFVKGIQTAHARLKKQQETAG